MWKKWEIWKDKRFWILLGLELLLAVIGIAGLLQGERTAADLDTMEVGSPGGTISRDQDGYVSCPGGDYEGDYLEASGFPLTPGVYRLRISYEKQGAGEAFIRLQDDNSSFLGLRANEVALTDGSREQSIQFYLLDHTDSVRILLRFSGDCTVVVKSLEVIATSQGSGVFLFWVLLLSALADILFVVYRFQERRAFQREEILVLVGIPAAAILASVPLFTDYLGWDMGLEPYLIRIEEMSRGLPGSLFFQENILFALPAIFRRIGLDMMMSYKLFLVLIHLATALASYQCLQSALQNRKAGILGSILYTLAPWRIEWIYCFGRVELFTALLFLPFLCCGIWRLCRRRPGWAGSLITGALGLLLCYVPGADWSGILKAVLGFALAFVISSLAFGPENENSRYAFICRWCCCLAAGLCILYAMYQTSEILLNQQSFIRLYSIESILPEGGGEAR